MDDTLQALSSRWNTSVGVRGSQEDKEELCQLHHRRRGVVQTWVHPLDFGVCERRPVCTNNGRTPRGDLW